MKKIILLLAFLLACGTAWASVTAEVQSVDLDENGNIRVWTIHKINGVEVESRYPKLDGHFVWATRYSKSNLSAFDSKGAEGFILADIQNYSKVLVQKEFDRTAAKSLNAIRVEYNAAANQEVITDKLGGLVGKSIATVETSEKIDTDADGVLDKELILKPDGTMTEKAYTAPVAEEVIP